MNSKKWAGYIIQRIILSKSDEEFFDLIQYVRKILSYVYIEKEDVLAVKLHFENARLLLEKHLAKYWNSAKWVKWPHQTSHFQVLMSYLFFPIQFETREEIISGLFNRENLHYLLAISASYDNVISLYYLGIILEKYDIQDDGDDDHEGTFMMREDMVCKQLGREQFERIKSYTTKPGENDGRPDYLCGLLCIAFGYVEEALMYFKRGYNDKDARCTYEYAYKLGENYIAMEEENNELQLKKAEAELGEALKKLTAMNEGLALLIKDFYIEDFDERVSNFIEAGKSGAPSGYRLAADLCAEKEDWEKALDYYLLAARNHIYSCYEDVASILIDQGHIEEANLVYHVLASAGSRYAAFHELSVLFGKEGDFDKASNYDRLSKIKGVKRIKLSDESKTINFHYKELKDLLYHEKEKGCDGTI